MLLSSRTQMMKLCGWEYCFQPKTFQSYSLEMFKRVNANLFSIKKNKIEFFGGHIWASLGIPGGP